MPPSTGASGCCNAYRRRPELGDAARGFGAAAVRVLSPLLKLKRQERRRAAQLLVELFQLLVDRLQRGVRLAAPSASVCVRVRAS